MSTGITPPAPLPTIPRLLSVKDTRELSAALGMDYGKQFVYYLYRQSPSRQYKTFTITKKAGGTRIIDAPTSGTRFLQERLLPLLEEVYKPKKCVHGFARDRSIISGANPHKRHGVVFNLDISDFFGSINFGRVRGLFMAAPYSLPESVATALAQICCNGNRLPQGACTSPVISNMICSRLDTELVKLSIKHRCFYTRYADDLTFSTARRTIPSHIAFFKSVPTGETVWVGDELKEIIHNNGFSINFSKLRFRRRSDRQLVTGLVVNRKVNVDRRFIRAVRGALHAWEAYGYDLAQQKFIEKYARFNQGPGRLGPQLSKVLRGRIEFIGSVRGWGDYLYLKLRAKFNNLSPEAIKKTGVASATQTTLATWVIEDGDDIIQGTAFYLDQYGFVTNLHCIGNSPVIFHPDDPTKKYAVTVRTSSEDYDLALLDIPPQLIPPKPLKGDFSEDAVLVGDEIRVIGYPNFAPGKNISVTPGSVASKEFVSGRPRLKVSAIIQAGNSGGPVLDQHDRVIGIAVTGVPSIDHPELEKFDMMVIPARSLRNLAY